MSGSGFVIPSSDPGNRTPEDVYGSGYHGWTWEDWGFYQREQWRIFGLRGQVSALYCNARLFGKLGRLIGKGIEELASWCGVLSAKFCVGPAFDTATTWPENYPPWKIPPCPDDPRLMGKCWGFWVPLKPGLGFPIVVDLHGNGIKTTAPSKSFFL